MAVTEEAGVWTIKTSTILKSMELEFKIGMTLEHTTPDGRDVSTVVTVEGNKFVYVQTAKQERKKSTKSVREFTNDGCILTMRLTGTDVVCVHKFK